MIRALLKLCAVAVIAAMPASLAWAQGLGYDQQAGDQDAAGPTGATRPLEQPILFVTGIEVLRSTLEPKIDVIRVSGLMSSNGWSAPQLQPFFYGRPKDD